MKDQTIPQSEPPDESQHIDTGGGGYVRGDVQAGRDVNLGATTILGDQVETKIVHDYGDWQPLPPYTPPSLPAPDQLPDPGPLPPGHRIPFGRNPLFTGRGEDLLALAALLLPGDGGGAAVVSSGIGGVGKTQLAVEFAYRYGRFFHGVHWVSMEIPEAVASEIAQCGAAMELRPGFDALPLEAQVRLTLDKWSRSELRLIIFDNCEDPALAHKWQPRGGGARLLVTSRNAVWPPELGMAVQPVRPMRRAASRALQREFLEPVGRMEPDEALDRVADEVGDLPLALTLAGRYLARYRQVTVDEYLAEVARADELLPLVRGAISLTKHELSVRRTFAVSYERLEASDPVDAAAGALLARAACFAPGEPLPEGLLRATMADVDTHRVDDGLLRLLELGLLERVEAETVRLHRLIGRFVAGELAEGMAAARAAVEGEIITLAFRQNRAGDPRALREWEIHLRHVTDAAFDREDDDAANLYDEMGRYLNMSGDLAGARPYYERVLAICERVLGPEHPDTARSLNNLGALLRAQGDLAGARPYYKRALAIYERVLGSEHPNTATSLNNMGVLLKAMGDLAGARPYYERALGIRERVLGPEHPTAAQQAATAQSLNNLGMLLQAMGDLAGARPYFERALAIWERVLGPEHPQTATAVNNLGGLLQAMGDLAGARPYYERALTISERVLGPEHPDTARSLNNMGGLLDSMDDPTGARPYFERALAISERVLGSDHPNTAMSLNNMGGLLSSMGDLAGARPYFERALAVRERVLGPEHPDTAQSLNNLGGLLYLLDDLAGARPYYERALAILETKLGPDHPHTRLVRDNLMAIEEAMHRS